MIARNERNRVEPGAREPGLESRAHTLPLRTMDDHDAWLVDSEPVHDGTGGVGTSVVDQDDFEIVEEIAGKRQDAIYGLGNTVLFVKRRNDDRQILVRSG